MDVVYYVGYGNNNAELRFSLRSVAKNLNHDRVIISGYPPEFTTNVAKLRVQGAGTSKKYMNAARNILAACQWEGTSDQFILFNDDFFVIEPVDEVQHHHRGTLDQAIENQRKRWGTNAYYRAMIATKKYLNAQGYDNPLAYHLHTPMVIDKEIMLQVLDDTGVVSNKGGRPNYLLRTIYGNVARIGGTRMRDVKVAGTTAHALQSVMKHHPPYLSTADQSFRNGAVGRFIVAQFPDPCEYEQQTPKRTRRANPKHPHRDR